MTLDDAQWVRNRKIHDPLYHRTRLRDQIDTVNQTVDQFLEQVGAFAETGETFELGAELHKMTLNISMRVRDYYNQSNCMPPCYIQVHLCGID